MKIKTELIRKKMADKHMTMKAAAAQADILPETFYAVMERGSCNGITLGKLARFCGLKAYELVDK